MLLDKKKVSMVTKVGAVIVSLTFIAYFIPFITSIPETINNTNQQGQGQVQVQQTLAALEQAAQKNPKSADAWVKLGNAYSDYAKSSNDSSALSKAIDSYRKALELDPNNVNARVDMAIQYFYSGQVETATAEARKAIEINPNHALAYFNLAEFLRASGKSEEAIQAYEKYIELDPKGEGVKLAKDRIAVLKKQK
ncbi:MAG: tetratricopeptide repeat protein [Firmicutes bacterium]|nr:tetratricopeptide repeat protein [Bacillota bacterium]